MVLAGYIAGWVGIVLVLAVFFREVRRRERRQAVNDGSGFENEIV